MISLRSLLRFTFNPEGVVRFNIFMNDFARNAIGKLKAKSLNCARVQYIYFVLALFLVLVFEHHEYR